MMILFRVTQGRAHTEKMPPTQKQKGDRKDAEGCQVLDHGSPGGFCPIASRESVTKSAA